MARRVLGRATLRAVRALEGTLEASDRRLLVACSGGADSLALAVAAREVRRRVGVPVRAVVVDHGLRPGSATLAYGVAVRVRDLGLETDVAAVVVRKDGSGPEAAARTSRYERLAALAAEQQATVLLGHTLDDQAETVLLGLARGSGLRSLAGMAPRRGDFLRPFLRLRRADTEAVCAEHGLEVWGDPDNLDPVFARVRVRERVLPVIEAELGPGVAEALARTARLARDDADLLDALADQARPQLGTEPEFQPEARSESGAEPGSLDCAQLAPLPDPLRRRVLLHWLRERGASDLSAAHVAEVDRLITDWHGQDRVEVPGLVVRRRAGRLWQADPGGGHRARP